MIAGFILKLFGGGIIGQIGGELNKAYKARLTAQNNSERIAADKSIAGLEARKAVLVAEAKTSWNVLFRAVLALPFALFVWKVIVWDKILGLGTTDDIGPDMYNLMMVVYGFYFVYETATLFKKNK